MLSRLSLKALITAVMIAILALVMATMASVFVIDRMVSEEITLREQTIRRAEHGATARIATHKDIGQTIALATSATIVMLAAAFAIGLVLALVAYRRVMRMVAAMEDFSARIDRGDFAARFAAEGVGEVVVLADALNRIVDRMQEAVEREAATSRRLSFLVAATPAVIYAAKVEGGYATTYISPNIRQQLGWAPEDFINDTGFWANHIHPEDRARVLALMDKLFTDDHIEIEYRFCHRGGAWRWMHDEMALVRDEVGAPREVVGSWLDITRRKEMELSLKRRDAILNAVAFGTARFLRTGEEASAAQWQLAVEAVLTHIGEATGVSRIWVAENSNAPDGDVTLRFIHCWTQPEFRVADDDPLFAQALSYQREGIGVEALRLRRGEILQVRAGDLPEAIRARFERLGIRSHVLAPIMVGNDWWGFMAFDDCADEHSWSEIEQEALRAAASLFGSAIASRSVHDSLRVTMESLGSVLEKLKRQSAEIERQNVELARANRMKSEFLAAITHELKTPLNAILGFSGVLDAGFAGELAQQQREYVGDILGAARQLHELVNRLLDLAQIDAGKKPFMPEETDIGALLRETVAMHAAAAQARSIAVTVEADEVMASVDARLLRQLLNELISNAIKFNHDGGTVTLRASVSPSLSPSPQPRSAPHGRLDTADRLRGPEAVLPEVPARPIKGEGVQLPSPLAGEGSGERGQVFIEVIDSGIGIAAADQAHLFEPFIQIDGSLERKYGGTGLGLALARRIVEMHDGHIAVDSVPGQGSRFTVKLPRRLAKQ